MAQTRRTILQAGAAVFTASAFAAGADSPPDAPYHAGKSGLAMENLMAEATAQMEKDAQAILAVERAAFERWATGDLSGFLDASDPEVDYFDPFLEARLEGLPALRALYSKEEMKAHVDRWEMINPRVIVSGDMGVLTFNFASYTKGKTARWNTTEVYRRRNGQWKIIHTHWAMTQPKLAPTPAAAQ